VGVPIQKENKGPLGPEAREGENGEEILSSDCEVWESVIRSPSGRVLVEIGLL